MKDFKRVNLLGRLLQMSAFFILFLSHTIRCTLPTVSPEVNYKLDNNDVSM